MIRIFNINKEILLDMGATLGQNSYTVAIDDEYTYDIILHPDVTLVAPSKHADLMLLRDGKAYILPANSFYRIMI